MITRADIVAIILNEADTEDWQFCALLLDKYGPFLSRLSEHIISRMTEEISSLIEKETKE